MIQTFVIPLENTPQNFAINLAGINYTMTVYWNDAQDAGWTMDLSDINDVAIAVGIPFVTGVDLLSGLEYLNINCQFFIYTTGDQTSVPTYDNLGIQSNLYFLADVSDG